MVSTALLLSLDYTDLWLSDYRKDSQIQLKVFAHRHVHKDHLVCAISDDVESLLRDGCQLSYFSCRYSLICIFQLSPGGAFRASIRVEKNMKYLLAWSFKLHAQPQLLHLAYNLRMAYHFPYRVTVSRIQFPRLSLLWRSQASL